MNDRIQNAFLGSLIADSIAMPVHWYYNTSALDRDYGVIEGYLPPRNPHPDSILWRSHYIAENEKGEILHDQAQYWGKRDIHYHQFLEAGDNTINYLLAIQLYRSTVRSGAYDPDRWLDLYVGLMQTPGWHRDTYLEEYHRAFFQNLSRGKSVRSCGIDDVHIGALASVPALIAALDTLQEGDPETEERIVREHVALTHRNRHADAAALALARMIQATSTGTPLRTSIAEHGSHWIGPARLERIGTVPDREVVGHLYSPACYLPDSFTAALCLAWRYADDFSGGIIANARCGGDSCHRGAVVGSLLGAASPELPEHWLSGLKSMERLRCDNLDPVFALNDRSVVD